jgi:hypothetical protein
MRPTESQEFRAPSSPPAFNRKPRPRRSKVSINRVVSTGRYRHGKHGILAAFARAETSQHKHPEMAGTGRSA